MELSRKEVVEIYSVLKNTELSGMTSKCRKAFLANAIKFQPIADKVTEENTKVADELRTEEYVKKFQAYMKAKTAFDKDKSEENTANLEKATKEFEPLFTDVETKFAEITKELTQTFDINVTKIPASDYCDYLDAKGKSFSFNDLTTLIKLIE